MLYGSGVSPAAAKLQLSEHAGICSFATAGETRVEEHYLQQLLHAHLPQLCIHVISLG